MVEFEALRNKHLAEMRAYTPQAIERLSWSRDRVLEEQTRRLREVVAHAQANSAFYTERIGHVEAAKMEIDDLRKLPPVTKDDVMSNWDKLMTDKRLRLADVETHLKRVLSGEEQNCYYLDE